MWHYHDTTNITGPALDRYEDKAQSQEQKILRFMKKHPGIYYEPGEIQIWLFASSDVPITSIRRALTNLTRDGHIVKSGLMTKGRYGRPVNQWVYPAKYEQAKLW